jgi:hypothetical protein
MKKMRCGSRPYYWLEERVNFNRRVFSQEPVPRLPVFHYTAVGACVLTTRLQVY